MHTGEHQPADRMRSLDVLRGLAVMGMILVNASAAMMYDNRAAVYPTLIHEHWAGLHLADTVFPAFLMMMGVAVPMSLGRIRGDAAARGSSIARIARRAGRLFLLGFVLSNLHWFAHFDAGAWRFWGVLQRIGIVYAACGMLFLVAGRRTWIAAIVVLLLGYWPLALIPQPDGQITDLWVRGLNFVGWADRATFGIGDHIYVTGPQGYDPEGLLGTLPAIAHGLIGVVIGDYLRHHPGPGKARVLMMAGALMLAAGCAWGMVFPVVKDLWSSTFVLVTCGLTTIVLGALHGLIDGRSSPARWPMTIALAFGGNAIAAYTLHEVTAFMMTWDLLVMPFRWAETWLPQALAALIPVALYMALIGWTMMWLRRRNWVIKV